MHSKEKINYLFLLVTILVCQPTYAQNTACIDVNNRITYSLPLHSILFTSSVSDNTNYIIGGYKEPADSGIILSKTFIDSIIWTKKFRSTEKNITISNVILLPDSSIVFTGRASNGQLLLIRFNDNGNMLWAKKFNLNLSGSTSNSGNQTNNSITFYNNYIYTVNGFFSTNQYYNNVSKLDLNGNIIWSNSLITLLPVSSYFSEPPLVYGDTIIVAANIRYNNISNSNIDSMAVVITKINTNTGSLISSTRFKTAQHNFIKGVTVFNSTLSLNNGINLTGVIGINYTGFPGGVAPITPIPFVLQLDSNCNFKNAKYFTYSGINGTDNPPSFTTSLNTKSESGFLLTDIFNRLAYTLNVDSNLKISRTKVFYPNSLLNFASERTFKLDDKKTNIFGFTYYNGSLNRTELEYFRVNNFAPANSLSCFGNDTTAFQANSFSTIKDTFLWDNQFVSLLYAQPFNLIEESFILNKQLICTQKSICDTIKIKGNNNHCLSNPLTTFTLYKNPQCLRKTNWIIDTAFIKIINQPNDTTINLQFLKPFHGYIRAAFDGCTLMDSFFINVNKPKQLLNLGKDTIFCPNKTIALNAGTGFKTYKWQNNSNDSIFTVSQPGIYFVEATDSCNNIFKDTINIKPMDVNFDLQYPNPICLYDTALLSVNPVLSNYVWTPSATAIKENNILKFFPENTTLYNITADRFAGCTLSDTLLIKVIDCPIYIYVPNAFTPNNDSRNDKFKPIISGKIEQYQFSIYNRYGQLIYNSKNINEGWSGTFKGLLQETGVFIWTCYYKFQKQEPKLKKGTVLLLK